MSGGGGRERSSRCVFVGNIPYDTTEEQLIEKFNEVGPVVSFRLVFDRDTGKPKGYGFCEFKDSETAMSAMRNLNGFELNGRPLRVDFAENEKGLEKRQKRGGAAGGGGRGRPGSRFDMGEGGPFGGEGEGFQGGGFEGGPPPPGVSHEQQIINILENMSTLQLYEMMAQMKTLIEQNRDQAREVLMGNPQFAFALLQAQVILGMVEPVVVQQILQQSQQPPPFPQQPVPPFAQQPPQMPMQGPPPPSYQDYPRPPEFGMPPGPMYPSQGLPPQQVPPPVVPPVAAPVGQMPPPPMGVPPSQPMMGMQPPPPQAQASLLDQQKLLLQQVMQLTPQQIETLPPLQRQQVQQLQMQIKSQLGAGLRPQ